MHAKTWRVDVYIFEEEGDVTRARAVLIGDAAEPLTGHGVSRRNPHDSEVPEIGDEVATARALRHIGDQLLGLADADIEQMTGSPSSLGG